MKNKPEWIKGKSFEEQKRVVQDFYIEEAKKLRKGVTIGGVKIHPWLYWHLNYWTFLKDLPPDEDGNIESVHSAPDLRDNEWLLQEALFKASAENKGIVGVGARRITKELADYERLITPNGFVPIGEIKEGDIVYGRDGKPTKVLGVARNGKKKIYRMTLMDGRSIDCGEEHQWLIIHKGKEKVVETKDLLKVKLSYKHKKGGFTYPYALPINDAIEFPTQDLNIHPYILGILLGDGNICSDGISFSCIDLDIVERVKNLLGENYSLTPSKKGIGKYEFDSYYIKYIGKDKYINDSKGFNPLIREIKKLSLNVDFSKKFIPEIYKFSSKEQRLELLKGLLDSDGSISKEGCIEFTVKNETLANDVLWLVRSLGYYGSLTKEDNGVVNKKFPNGKFYDVDTLKYRVYIRSKDPIFYCKRKLDRVNIKRDKRYNKKVSIKSIEYIGEVSASCIGVDNSDKLYLTEDCIVTHNSVFISSFTAWNATTKFGGELRVNSVIGGTQKDLDNIADYIDYGLDNIHPFFRMDRVGKDWTKGVTLGTRNSDNSKEIFSKMTITNVNMGTTKSTQKTAGATPNSLVFDEAGKYSFLKSFNTAKYSIATEHGWRTTPIVFGTSGEMSEAGDLQKMVNNPSLYKMIEMDWEWLERRYNKPTWTKKVWGVFFPGQMSLDAGLPKKKINLGEYLDNDSEDLKEIEFYETQWVESTEIMTARRKLLERSDKKAYDDELMFMPLDPEDCFLDGGSNPFPMAEATRHKNKIVQEGNIGSVMDPFKKGDQSDTQIVFDFSKKPIAEFPFEGGILDCGVQVFEAPPEDNSFDFTYVAGLDHYKHIESTGDSIGALYIFKRHVNLNDEFSNRIVCSYVSRPASMNTFNRTCEILLEGYGAECLQENADISFQQYLESKGKDVKLLANGEVIAQRLISGNARQVNKYGLSPTTKNKEYLMKVIVSYCWEIVDSYLDKDGNEISILGVERINDVQLLDEIISYKPGKNVDRIVAFAHALVWSRYLDDIRVLPKVKNKKASPNARLEREERKVYIKEMVRSNPYASHKRVRPRRN